MRATTTQTVYNGGNPNCAQLTQPQPSQVRKRLGAEFFEKVTGFNSSDVTKKVALHLTQPILHLARLTRPELYFCRSCVRLNQAFAGEIGRT